MAIEAKLRAAPDCASRHNLIPVFSLFAARDSSGLLAQSLPSGMNKYNPVRHSPHVARLQTTVRRKQKWKGTSGQASALKTR